mmetsp:Transcript_11518/g.15326  ORF Transcript_11518/g.15326 Transcript_11518/m.15326 type:complete len:283 (-) Transcript_11518:25-873(-)|eukprot:CAMPEP_0201489196 /NCGR_PEP_ID=MMETSP0151_2-20130828/21170_1 /ASSEMBLY_ACC=CAM_ASM_000257 /TAXON_ID=200890 /ORGANISM="Paramoeba atlantica, Strain 621/1 / CCAP 1560/9" /LENGTH=282 /DNA_ID=CAMNT_0047874699 /DNA_START=64 /DNA_END=912 /DNA_ORIENTATION=-
MSLFGKGKSFAFEGFQIDNDFRDENIMCERVGKVLYFRCMTCQKLFREEIFVLKHLKLKHKHLFPSEIDPVDIEIEEEERVERAKMREMKKEEIIEDNYLQEGDERFRCLECKKRFKGKNFVRKHVVKQHAHLFEFEDDPVPVPFSRFRKKYMKQVNPERFTCRLCYKQFMAEVFVWKHYLRRHKKVFREEPISFQIHDIILQMETEIKSKGSIEEGEERREEENHISQNEANERVFEEGEEEGESLDEEKDDTFKDSDDGTNWNGSMSGGEGEKDKLNIDE